MVISSRETQRENKSPADRVACQETVRLMQECCWCCHTGEQSRTLQRPQSLSAAMMDRELQHVDVIIEAVKDQSRERSVEKLTIEINAGPSVARVSGQVSRVDEPRSSLDEGNTVEGRKEGRKWPHHRKSDLLSSDRRQEGELQ